jgi:hypothetical protein
MVSGRNPGRGRWFNELFFLTASIQDSPGASPMLRFVASVAVLFVATSLFAAEYKGKVKSVDTAANTITVTVDDKDVTLKVNGDTKFTAAKAKQADKVSAAGLTFKGFKKGGQSVVITTTGEGDKEVATEVKLGGGKKKKNNQ